MIEVPDDESRHAAQTLAEVSAQLAAVAGTLRDVKNRQGRQGVRLWLVILGFTLDVVLTVVIGVILSRQVGQGNQLVDVQNRIRANQISACLQGNSLRTKQYLAQIKVIDDNVKFVMNYLPPAARPAYVKVAANQVASLGSAYGPLNCQALYSIADGGN